MAFKLKDRRYPVVCYVERLECATSIRRAENFLLSESERRLAAADIKLSVERYRQVSY